MSNESDALVHIIDDDAAMRNTLRMFVQSAALRCEVYDSAEAFLTDADLTHAGCIILDLRMPGMDGFELLRRLRLDMIALPVILLSGHADVPTTVRGMKLGAVDLLQKPVEPTVLLEAVKRSVESSRAVHRQRSQDEALGQRFDALTPRELELVKLIADGRANKQIAAEMGIAIKTVENHRASLMSKTGASNAADLARLFTIAGGGAARSLNQPH